MLEMHKAASLIVVAESRALDDELRRTLRQGTMRE
jgi:hypothetical protein